MPSTKLKNIAYRMALPVLAPRIKKKNMSHVTLGRSMDNFLEYEHLLKKHHVLGSAFFLKNAGETSQTFTSLQHPEREIEVNSLFRVASITKTLTTLVTLRLAEQGMFSLNTPVDVLLGSEGKYESLTGVTVEKILCHTSGIVDIPEYETAVKKHQSLYELLANPGLKQHRPGEMMIYSNCAFGVLGSALEEVSGKSLRQLFSSELCEPLDMCGGFTLDENEKSHAVPMNRALPYRKENQVQMTPLGEAAMESPDPEHHFGYTAGGFYTDCISLSHVLTMLTENGKFAGQQYLSPETVKNMKSLHASTPERRYGLGLVLLDRADISGNRIIGHQGFAYGCVDGMFVEENTGRQVIMLNGGCSELRDGRLAVSNRDFIRFGLREMTSWEK